MICQTTLLADPDKDGVITATEVALGTDPHNADTNGDGISDGVELGTARSPTSVDLDGDGLSNVVEKQLGTDPFNPDSDGNCLTHSQDCFPLDATRWQCPPPVGGDITPPVNPPTEPTNAVLISSTPIGRGR